MAKNAYAGLHVKCINQSWCAADLTEGNVYEVITEVGEEKEYFSIIDNNGRTGVYYKERFVITNESVTK
jgi:hypothetical protein